MDLYKFFDSVIPETGDSFYIQRQMDYNPTLGKSVFFTKYKTRADFINNLIFATEQKQYTVFYSANSYIKDRGRTAKNIRGMKAKSLIIDIDGIEEIENISEKNIEEFLKEKYLIEQHQLPNYICFSGHGLHLYYILTEEADNDDTRKETHKNLVNLYFADKSCVPFCHCFRVPCSYNLKNGNALKTRIYKTSNNRTYKISEFSWVEDIFESEKYLKKISENTTDIKSKKNSKPKEKKSQTKQAEKINEDVINFGLKILNHSEANNRYTHLLIDLHNFYVRHNGLPVGVRHNFVFILSNILKCCKYSEQDAIKYIHKFIPESHSFYSEAISDLSRVYSDEKIHHFRNNTIADMLGFT